MPILINYFHLVIKNLGDLGDLAVFSVDSFFSA